MIKHVELVNKDGKILRGYLDMPENFCGEIIVMFHGFTGNKSEHGYHFRNISRLMSKEGFASLRLDFSGNGESDGEFKDFTFDTMMDEAKMIIDYAFSLDGVKDVSLLGFSMGGAVSSIMSSIYKNKIKRIILWSAAACIKEHIKNYYESGVILENKNSLHGAFELSYDMYKSIDKCEPFNGIETYTNPVLLVHGSKDLCINPNYSKEYNKLYSNSTLHFVEGAGHGYDRYNEFNELYDVTINFLLNRK